MKCEFRFYSNTMNVLILNAIINELNTMKLTHSNGFTKREFEQAKEKVYQKIDSTRPSLRQAVSLDWFLGRDYIRKIDVERIQIPSNNVIIKMPNGTTERATMDYRNECSVTIAMPDTGSVIIERETIDAKRYIYAINGYKFDDDLKDAIVDFNKTIDKMNATIFAAKSIMRY